MTRHRSLSIDKPLCTPIGPGCVNKKRSPRNTCTFISSGSASLSHTFAFYVGELTPHVL